MFDIGFWELSLIMVVVLLVVGPERLPRLARTAGIWVGRARRMVAEVKAEVDRELRAQELKETMGSQGLEQLKGAADELRTIGSELKTDVQELGTKSPSSGVTEEAPATAAVDATEDSRADGAPPKDV